MAKFSCVMQRTASATASIGAISAPASGMRRSKIFDATFGSEGAPSDVANIWRLSRTTAAGTSTAITPKQLDLADAAAVTVVGQNHTVEPTYSNAGADISLDVPLNQKATYRWVAVPGGEIVIPATANAGYGLLTPTAGSAVAVTAWIHFEEQ